MMCTARRPPSPPFVDEANWAKWNMKSFAYGGSDSPGPIPDNSKSYIPRSISLATSVQLAIELLIPAHIVRTKTSISARALISLLRSSSRFRCSATPSF